MQGHLHCLTCLVAWDAGADAKAMLRMVQAKGAGYAMSKQQELETMQQVAQSTGVYQPALVTITNARVTGCVRTWPMPQLCNSQR